MTIFLKALVLLMIVDLIAGDIRESNERIAKLKKEKPDDNTRSSD